MREREKRGGIKSRGCSREEGGCRSGESVSSSPCQPNETHVRKSDGEEVGMVLGEHEHLSASYNGLPFISTPRVHFPLLSDSCPSLGMADAVRSRDFVHPRLRVSAHGAAV